ncbi:hypothetical protein Ahy_B10g101488 [Arachis hypogaea]|uniref:Aminotransferase-like plant mobile domain-containing protein n=1 Tax=Arachis hypogaea TaxID=3818 RepID=A0A444WZV7_ARAHY|nr:hypothetical protein Ahy_B10g101488 [Arachis hypogaea]
MVCNPDINQLNAVGAVDFEYVEELLGARPPLPVQQGAQRKEAFNIKMTWLRDRVRQMPPTDDLATDNSTPDFGRCSGLSWGSAVLAWTYHSLCHAARRNTTDIAGCTPLLMS